MDVFCNEFPRYLTNVGVEIITQLRWLDLFHSSWDAQLEFSFEAIWNKIYQDQLQLGVEQEKDKCH